MNRLNSESLRVSVEESLVPLPDWGRAAVEIGAWARYAAVSNNSRLIVCCVVPCRSVFSALVGLGAAAAGGALFTEGFSWTDLLRLEAGTEIFWAAPGVKQKLVGVLQAHEEVCGQLMVPVSITKGPRRMHGVRWQFTESKFRECIFSEEKLPPSAAVDQFESAGRFYKQLGISAESSWLMTAGAELRFVANRAAFRRSLEGWGLTSDGENDSAPVDKLLILRDEGDSSFAKARISHVHGPITGVSPVSILDGPLAFRRYPDIETGSLVVVLERGELADEHLDLLIQARNEHSLDHERELIDYAPKSIPATVEVTGYCMRVP